MCFINYIAEFAFNYVDKHLFGYIRTFLILKIYIFRVT